MKLCLSSIVVLCLGTCIASCTPSYGPALGGTRSATQDVYLYGPHEGTAVSLASDDDGSPARVTSEDGDDLTLEASSSVSKKPAGVTVEVEQEEAAEASRGKAIAGVYRGTDWVTIDLPGFPENEQVDEKARVTLRKVNDAGVYDFTVLDTNTGAELCSVEATLTGELLAFEPGQTCFEGILGIPMEATLYEGEGRVANGRLKVTLGVEMTVSGTQAEVSGDLSYRFEGKFDAPIDDSK